jgi:hypothetical protein
MKFILIGIIFLTGCTDNSIHSQGLGFKIVNDAVKEVKLSDGTPCAVFQGVHGGGITCNWKK